MASVSFTAYRIVYLLVASLIVTTIHHMVPHWPFWLKFGVDLVVLYVVVSAARSFYPGPM